MRTRHRQTYGAKRCRRQGRFLALGALLAAVGIALIVVGARWSPAQLDKVRGYRTAPVCPHGESVTGDVGCLTLMTGTVRGRSVSTHYDPPTCTTRTDPLTHNTTTTCSGGGTSYSYSVKIAGPGGHTEVLDVDHDFYKAAERGAEARLRYWRGQVVEATVGSQHKRFPPNSLLVLVILWLGMWAGAGLFAAGVYGMVSREGYYDGGVVRTALGVWTGLGAFVSWAAGYIATYGLGPVMLTVLSLLGALVLVLGAVFLHGEWRARRSRPRPASGPWP